MSYIWVTRGFAWGFRFLSDGGCAEPLLEYESAFAGIEPGPNAFARSADCVALRFPDPEDRKDASGRVIPHEFVVFSPLAEQFESGDHATTIMWALVASRFDDLWDADSPSA